MNDIMGKARHPRRKTFPKLMAEDTLIFSGLPKEVIRNLKKSKEFAPVLLENLDKKKK